MIKCLIEVKEFTEALSMLLNEDIDDKKNTSTSRTFASAELDSLRIQFNLSEEESMSVGIFSSLTKYCVFSNCYLKFSV